MLAVEIHLPMANIDASEIVPQNIQYDPWNFVLTLMASRELGGIFTHWSQCNIIWGRLSGPLGDLVGFGGENAIWAQCGDSENGMHFAM